MNKLGIALFSMLLLSVSIAVAQEEDPGITPDSPLWGLDKALEQIELLLAAGDVEKAKVELEHAHERLIEVKAMIETNKLEHAERARVEHKIKTDRIKERVRRIDADDEDAIEEEIEIEKEVEEEEREIEEVKRTIKLRFRGELTDEQRARIDALIDSFRNSTNDVRIVIERKKNETRVSIKIRERLSDDEVDDLIEEHENRTGLNEIKMEKAREQIEDAEEEIQEAKEKLLEEFGSNATIPKPGFVLIKQAELHLENAKNAFEEGFFGRAYGQATAAEHIAENIKRRLEHMDDRETMELERRIDREKREMMEEIEEKMRERRDDRRPVCEIGKEYLHSAVNPVSCQCPEDYEFKTISMTFGGCPVEGMTDCLASVLMCVKEDDDEDNEGKILDEDEREGIASSSLVDLIGIVDYEGEPNPDNLVAIHGWKYFFKVDVEHQERAKSYGISLDHGITLMGDQLKPELEQKNVRIKGTYISNYQEYLQSKGMPISSADPEGQVIKISGLEVLTR